MKRIILGNRCDVCAFTVFFCLMMMFLFQNLALAQENGQNQNPLLNWREDGRNPDDFEVLSLLPSGNAAMEVDDGNGKTRTKTFIVPVTANATLTVVATPQPDTTEENLPDEWTLTGGTGTGKLSRTVPLSAPGKFVLHCKCGKSEKETTIYVVKIQVNATDLYGTVQRNQDGSSKTAYVHWNIDNDNNSEASQSGKHPDADCLKNSTVQGEDDLKAFSISILPSGANFPKGGVLAVSIGQKGKIWKNSLKGNSGQLICTGNLPKCWALKDDAERSSFQQISTFYVEGVDGGNEMLTVAINDDDGLPIVSDSIPYSFIAADCGNQPLINQKNIFSVFPSLTGCEWSIIGNNSQYYNCIAWTVGITNKWINKTGITGPTPTKYLISIDRTFGNNDGTMSLDELDCFYNFYGYIVTYNPNEAIVVYFDNYHGAIRKNCNDGNGVWNDMFESKCGESYIIEHRLTQLIGYKYGVPCRYYKRQ